MTSKPLLLTTAVFSRVPGLAQGTAPRESKLNNQGFCELVVKPLAV